MFRKILLFLCLFITPVFAEEIRDGAVIWNVENGNISVSLDYDYIEIKKMSTPAVLSLDDEFAENEGDGLPYVGANPISYFPLQSDTLNVANKAREYMTNKVYDRGSAHQVVFGVHSISCRVSNTKIEECPVEKLESSYVIQQYWAPFLEGGDGLTSIEFDNDKLLFYSNPSATSQGSLYRVNYITPSILTSGTDMGNRVKASMPEQYSGYASEKGYNQGFIYNGFLDLYYNYYTNTTGIYQSSTVEVLYYVKQDFTVKYNIFAYGSNPWVDFYGVADHMGPTVLPDREFSTDSFCPDNGCYASGISGQLYPSAIVDPVSIDFFDAAISDLERGSSYFNFYRAYRGEDGYSYYDYIFVPLDGYKDEQVYWSAEALDGGTNPTHFAVIIDGALNNVSFLRYRSDNLSTPYYFGSLSGLYLSNVKSGTNQFIFEMSTEMDEMTGEKDASAVYLFDRFNCLDTNTGVYSVMLSFSNDIETPTVWFNKKSSGILSVNYYYDALELFGFNRVGTITTPDDLPTIDGENSLPSVNNMAQSLYSLAQSLEDLSGMIDSYFDDFTYHVRQLPDVANTLAVYGSMVYVSALIDKFVIMFPIVHALMMFILITRMIVLLLRKGG